MPNRSQHVKEGAVAGAVVGALCDALCQAGEMQAGQRRSFDAGEALLSATTGAVVGSAAATLPDVLEPAHHPHHRKFFHSFTAGSLVLYGACRVYESEPSNLGSATILSAGTGYAIHLLSDNSTDFGIPLLM